jgi:rhodanese-related sulfurtransferase
LRVPSEVTIDQLADALSADAYVLDVRRDDEYAEKRVPGVVHIPMDQLDARIDEIPRDKKIWVLCAAGARSLRVAEALENAGFDAVSVAGGTNQWAEEGRPVEAG